MDQNAQTAVKCNVVECMYNDKDICTASSIEVDSLTGLLAKAHTSEDTECVTFKPKPKK